MNSERARGLVLLAAIFLLGLGSAQDGNPVKDERRNPFLLPEGVYPLGKGPPAQVEALILQAILSVDGKKTATISNMNFVVGDWVFGREVVAILEDQVVLAAKGIRSILQLKTSPFPIRVKNTN